MSSGPLYYKSDKIIDVDGPGVLTCETELIESVTQNPAITQYNKRTTDDLYGITPRKWEDATGEVLNVPINTPAGGGTNEPTIMFEFPLHFVRKNQL